ncbi:MAG: Uma2 family endonuclease [Thermoguttaceae bacterium]
MSTPTQNITTADELLRAPSDLGSCELVRGELVMMSPGKGQHAAVGARVVRALSNHVHAHRLGEVFDSSAGYVLSRDPDTVREPDVSFLTVERLKKQDLDAFLEGAPDLCVEILSPGNTAAEMRSKMEDYFAAGCRVMWIVDPLRRSVAVHRPESGPLMLTEDDTLTEEGLLPGFSLAVREIFPPA